MILRVAWRNLGTFLLALALSLGVWISAVVADDPNEVRELSRPVPLEVRGLDDDLVLVGSIPQQLSVSLRAPRSLWERLTIETGLVRAYLDMSDLPAGEYVLPVEVALGISPVQVVQVLPAEVPVVLEWLVVETLPIEIEVVGEPALGFLREGFGLDIAAATVSGPESLVEKVATVRATIDISGARQDVIAEVELRVLDSDGQVLDGLVIEPATVTVFQSIRQAGGYRDVAVKVETIGQLANGYRVTNISVSPPTVTIFSADPRLVAEMPGFVITQPLDLEGADDDIETRLSLVLPEGVVLVSQEQSVLVQVGVAAIESSIQISIEVETLGLQPGLAAVLSPPVVDLILSGPLPVLEGLKPEDVHIYADLTGLGVGTHLVELRGEILPTGVTIDSLTPGNVEATISNSSATPSPTPVGQPEGTSTPTPDP